MTIRVVIADDSLLVREGIARVLTDAAFEVVGQAGDVAGLMELIGSSEPDVAIVDIRMPPTFSDEGDGADRDPRAPWAVNGRPRALAPTEAAFAMRLLSEGSAGTGYLLKDRIADLEDLTDAIRRVARGGTVVDPAVVAPLDSAGRATPDPLAELTEREREVLALMAEGRSNQAIADRLVVTVKTVEAHTASIFSKLGLLPAPDDHRRVLAVLAFLEA
jgi:DNA-binding NarL/FixJ family response regulator